MQPCPVCGSLGVDAAGYCVQCRTYRGLPGGPTQPGAPISGPPGYPTAPGYPPPLPQPRPAQPQSPPPRNRSPLLVPLIALSSVLVILVATMAANTLYFLRTSADSQEQQLVDRGRALGRLISLVSPEAILGYDYLLLNDYTREVAMQRDVVYAVIVTAQGVPISASICASPSCSPALRVTSRVA